MRPLIGITCHNAEGEPDPGIYQSRYAYAQRVAEAGGLPVILPQEVSLVDDYVARLDGFVLSGGDDIDVRAFGEELHPKADVMNPRRQAFDLALLEALKRKQPDKAVFGICLGMQLMSVHAGGKMRQHIHEVLGEEQGESHRGNRRHPVVLDLRHPVLSTADGTIVSSHHQAVAESKLRVLAHAPDGTVEAVDDPSRRFYFGVQWHPERYDLSRGDGEALNPGLFRAFVDAARGSR